MPYCQNNSKIPTWKIQYHVLGGKNMVHLYLKPLSSTNLFFYYIHLFIQSQCILHNIVVSSKLITWHCFPVWILFLGLWHISLLFFPVVLIFRDLKFIGPPFLSVFFLKYVFYHTCFIFLCFILWSTRNVVIEKK